MSRRARRTDANQAAIVEVLRARGAIVWIIEAPVDLLVFFDGRFTPREVKNEHGRNRLTPQQIEFFAAVGGAAALVHTPQEALDALPLGDELPY